MVKSVVAVFAQSIAEACRSQIDIDHVDESSWNLLWTGIERHVQVT
jgi:hypothetical protein